MINPEGVYKDEKSGKWCVNHNGEWYATFDNWQDAYDSWCAACQADWEDEDYEARAYDDDEE